MQMQEQEAQQRQTKSKVKSKRTSKCKGKCKSHCRSLHFGRDDRSWVKEVATSTSKWESQLVFYFDYEVA